MGKEKVVIFAGEDKFVKKRHHRYDSRKGKSEFVGTNGTSEAGQVAPTTEVPLGDPQNQIAKPIIPNQGEPDFCNRLFQFISTRGGGTADNDAVMEAHRRFQQYCANPEESTTTTSTTSSTTTLSGLIPVIPVISGTGLGIAPGGGGGGGDEAGPVEKPKKSYFGLIVLAALILYVFKGKKEN